MFSRIIFKNYFQEVFQEVFSRSVIMLQYAMFVLLSIATNTFILEEHSLKLKYPNNLQHSIKNKLQAEKKLTEKKLTEKNLKEKKIKEKILRIVAIILFIRILSDIVITSYLNHESLKELDCKNNKVIEYILTNNIKQKLKMDLLHMPQDEFAEKIYLFSEYEDPYRDVKFSSEDKLKKELYVKVFYLLYYCTLHRRYLCSRYEQLMEHEKLNCDRFEYRHIAAVIVDITFPSFLTYMNCQLIPDPYLQIILQDKLLLDYVINSIVENTFILKNMINNLTKTTFKKNILEIKKTIIEAIYKSNNSKTKDLLKEFHDNALVYKAHRLYAYLANKISNYDNSEVKCIFNKLEELNRCLQQLEKFEIYKYLNIGFNYDSFVIKLNDLIQRNEKDFSKYAPLFT